MVTRGKIDDYKCPKLEKLNNTDLFQDAEAAT